MYMDVCVHAVRNFCLQTVIETDFSTIFLCVPCFRVLRCDNDDDDIYMYMYI